MKQDLFLKTGLIAAKKAEKIIENFYKKNIVFDLKSDKTPVTQADIQAEQVITKTIKEKFPTHGFLGEELGQQNLKKEFNWVIDPIDGTKSFIRKLPLFGTQIALVKKEKIILGISNNPITKELIFAEKNKGAFVNKRKIKVSNVKKLNEAHLSISGFKHFVNEKGFDKKILNIINSVQRIRSYGDFWAYQLLAEGKIDIVIESNIRIWDIAAMKVIIEEAGGKMTDFEGKEINFETRNVIATNGHIHGDVLKIFTKS